MSIELARRVLEIEAEAIHSLIRRLDRRFTQAVDILQACRGRVVTSGMGKSGLICRKIAATFASTGTPSLFLHPAEALHGDLGMLAPGDVVLAVSYSGETEELLRLVGALKRLAIPLISLVGNQTSTLARHSEVVLDVGVSQEACPLGLAPTASTTAALALGDALALALSHRKGFQVEEFARLHPGGKLGKRLARVEELMHTGGQVPQVTPDTRMGEAIVEMSRKGLGITAVVAADRRLVGVLSDGDLRRLLERRREGLLELRVEECMTRNPITIPSWELATAALNLMEQRKITSLMVVGADDRLAGVIHLHDLWGTEMF